MHACMPCLYCLYIILLPPFIAPHLHRETANKLKNKCGMHACFVVCLHHVQLSSCHIRCCTFAPTNMLYRHLHMIMCKCLSDHVQVRVHVLAKPFLALHLHQTNWDKTPDAPERTQPLVVLHGGPQVPSDYLFDLAKVRPKP